jgi:hypothetical protein
MSLDDIAARIVRKEPVRWTPARKAAVVAAIASGKLDEQAAMRLYMISSDELAEWRRGLSRAGHQGLCVTKRATVGANVVRMVPAGPDSANVVHLARTPGRDGSRS